MVRPNKEDLLYYYEQYGPVITYFLTLSGAGVWRLNLGRGVKNTPPLYINVSTAIDPKMVPNLISRQD